MPVRGDAERPEQCDDGIPLDLVLLAGLELWLWFLRRQEDGGAVGRRRVRKKTPGVWCSRGSVRRDSRMGCAAAGYAVQKLLPVRGGLNAYLAAPDGLVNERSRECPFCDHKHRLRLHGHYRRCVLVEDGRTAEVSVRRLLCPRVGRTVSLLPDFCIPRRQHGAAVLGTFLAGYAEGKPLLAALRAVRPEAPGHSVAQSLRRGFLARGGSIRTYLAGLRARALEPAPSAAGLRGQVSVLLGALCLGFATAAEAFVHHGLGLHAMQQIGLA